MTLYKRALQIGITVGGFVPVLAGFFGILFGPGMVAGAHAHFEQSISLDSHYRYLSGLLLGIGLAFWSTIPNIENNGARFRVLTLIVFIGGLGRLWSLLMIGTPDSPMLFGLMMELIITPVFAFMQYRLAQKIRR